MLWKDMARPSLLTALTQQDNLRRPRGSPAVLPSYRLRASAARPLVKDAEQLPGRDFPQQGPQARGHVRLAASVSALQLGASGVSRTGPPGRRAAGRGWSDWGRVAKWNK